VVIAIGGMTYPLYLLHHQIRYVALNWIGPVANPTALAVTVVLAIALLSWATWRCVERPTQRLTKHTFTGIAGRFGWTTKLAMVSSPVSPSI
jgi:peptidoglycan/LPS O-acetylase OafA/YrhL